MNSLVTPTDPAGAVSEERLSSLRKMYGYRAFGESRDENDDKAREFADVAIAISELLALRQQLAELQREHSLTRQNHDAMQRRLEEVLGFNAEREQQLAEMRELLGTVACAYRNGFLPPTDWLKDASVALGLPETNETPWMRSSSDERKLRRMLASAYSGTDLYGDDGELQDSRVRPFIDYKRDSVDEIAHAIQERGRAALSSTERKEAGTP